jgi:iron complex outermembrane receptor protein
MKVYLRSVILTILFFLFARQAGAQSGSVTGKISADDLPVESASVRIIAAGLGTFSDSLGFFKINNIPEGNYTLLVSRIGYDDYEKSIIVQGGDELTLGIVLTANPATLNEVVVTGVSRATLIRGNPVSIIAVSPKQIEQTSQDNIIDVLVKNVPGLNAVKTGPNISKPFIRGLGYNRVLTLYDGIRQEGQQWGDEHGIEVDDYNIDRAEVIKGPASLMFGSDALAGVVSLFPYVPENNEGKWHGRITSEYQTNNNLIGNGLRLNYNSKRILFALSGSYRVAKNYRNAVDGRVYNSNFDEKNLSTLIGYKSAKGYSRLNLTLYDNLQGIPDGSRDSLTRKFTKQIYEGEDDTIKNRPIVPDNELNSYRLSSLHQHIQHYRIYTHNFYKMGNGDLSFLLAFQQNIRREYDHPTMPLQPGMHVRLNTLNYGLRYNAPKFLNIEATVGVNGMLQRNKSIRATDFPIPDYNLFDGGIYLYEKWKQNKWSVSGGVRYDIRHVQWNDFHVGINPSTGFDEHIPPGVANAKLQFPGYKKDFSGISASLGLTLQASKKFSIKANIARGYRAPNITEMGSHGLDPGAHIIYLGNRNFNPEFSLQEDIGANAKFRDVSAELSLFNNNIQDYIYLTMLVDANGKPVVDAQGNKTYQYQQASAQLYGMEASISIHPEKIKAFSFDNSFSAVYGFNRKTDYKSERRKGEYLPLIPPVKLLSSLAQTFQARSKVITIITPKIEMEFNAVQNRVLGLNKTETLTPGYALFNIGAVTEIKYSQKQALQFQFHINNLFDKSYQSHLNRLKYFEYYSYSSNGHFGIYNMGRNICVKMILPF